MTRRDTFISIRTEGAILPHDVLRRIADGDKGLPGLRAEDYGLAPGEKLNEAISRSWNRLSGLWRLFRATIERLPEADLATGETRRRWLLPLFDELRFGQVPVSDSVVIDGRPYPISHCWHNVPIHLVGARVELDRRTPGAAGAARSSPHSLVQEFLNRSGDHLWGVVSNGLRLRLLRDNVSLTRQAYVEFDIEAIFDGEVYSDFVVLWLTCHATRMTADRPEDFWIEKWSKFAREQGARALDQLRDGVQRSLEALGRGFLSHPANGALRDRMRSGGLDRQDYYRQVLRLVYRLLFLFVAEDRDLLLDPGADAAARRRYMDHYALGRLRRLAERRRGTRHGDLWQALRLVFRLLGADAPTPALGLYPLGSYLWSDGATPDLMSSELANTDLLESIRALAFLHDRHGVRPVDFRNLRSEELGSVYESLLELHPEVNLEAATFSLTTASGHERKTTGSYYTPESLVQCLLDSALDPVLDEACRKPDPAAAILQMKVCDPACGSGHFLIAASHRMARRLAAIRTGDEEPSPQATQAALRDVIGHCIYGVDINPMAVELCKIALWMEALEPGKPLSFLEHRIRCGNSLLGATPALLARGIPDEAFIPIEGDDKKVCSEWKKRNKKERTGQQSLFTATGMPWDRLGDHASAMLDLIGMHDDTIEGLRKRQQQYEALVRSDAYLFDRLWADAWCAAFVWRKVTDPALPYPVTHEVFRRIQQNPWTAERWMRDEIRRLAEQYQFFHWHLEFPDVFRPAAGPVAEDDPCGWDGGFDVVLGNPPWERVTFNDEQWFASRRPEIANASNAAERRRMIQTLAQDDPGLLAKCLDARRQQEGWAKALRFSGRFPLCGVGDVNTYAVFAELNRQTIACAGRAGFIVPTGLVTDLNTSAFFRSITDTQSLSSLYSFENEAFVFPHIHHATKFCLITLSGRRVRIGSPDLLFFARQVEDLADEDRHFSLSAADVRLLNPNSLTCPIFRQKRDAEIMKSIHRSVPILVREGSPDGNPWRVDLCRMYHMGDDSELFRTADQLRSEGFQRNGNVFASDSGRYLPLVEGKMVFQFDHRFGTYLGQTEAQARQGKLPEVGPLEHDDPGFVTEPHYWVADTDVKSWFEERWARKWILGWRNITSAVATRTVVCSVAPVSAFGDTFPLAFLRHESSGSACWWLGVMNSFVVDYACRQKIGGNHLTYTYLMQLPVLPPHTFQMAAGWAPGEDVGEWIRCRVLELAFTAWDLEPFAQDCGYYGPPFHWDEDRRFLIRCELDAAFFHMYQLGRESVDYILNSFPLVRDSDVARHGTYRTKDSILDIYDRMQRAIDTGVPYQTILDPPPADPRVAHPPQPEPGAGNP